MKKAASLLFAIVFLVFGSSNLCAKTLLLVDFDQTLTLGDAACNGRKLPCVLKEEAAAFLKDLINRAQRNKDLTWYIWTNNFRNMVLNALEKSEIDIYKVAIIDAESSNGSKTKWANQEIELKAYDKVIVVDDEIKNLNQIVCPAVTKLIRYQAQKKMLHESTNETEFWKRIIGQVFDEAEEETCIIS
jgi:hypothetical protein